MLCLNPFGLCHRLLLICSAKLAIYIKRTKNFCKKFGRERKKPLPLHLKEKGIKFFHAMKIHFHALMIYFHGMKIVFHDVKIVSCNVWEAFMVR